MTIRELKDYYKALNKRRETAKKIGKILLDSYYNTINGTNIEERDKKNAIKQISKEYRIDQRTVYKYIGDKFVKIGNNSVLLLNDIDIFIIESTLSTFKKYEIQNKKNKETIKFVTTYMLGTIPK